MFTSTHVGPNDRTSARIVALAPALACVSGVPGAFAQQKEDSAMSLNDCGKAWWKALARAGLGHYDADGHWQGEFTWHGLRHTCATWLRSSGAPDWAIDALGGWSRAATRERYSHVRVESLRPFAQMIDTVLTQQPDVSAAQHR